VSVIFLHPAWGGRQGFVSRDDRPRDDTIQAKWQQGDQNVKEWELVWEEGERNARVTASEKPARIANASQPPADVWRSLERVAPGFIESVHYRLRSVGLTLN
jgi:hypothetical protein